MTPKTALLTVLLWGIIFACVGSAIGGAIGIVAPGYYQSVFRNGQSPDFDPLQVGIGLGATQGIATGVAISIAVLALIAWRDVRSARHAMDSDAANTDSRSRRWLLHVLWGVVTAILVLIVSPAAFILGGIVGQQQLYQSWTERKLDKLATILKSNQFEGVESEFSSAAQVYLTGTIKDDAARDSLREKLVVTFGTEEADKMIGRVDIVP